MPEQEEDARHPPPCGFDWSSSQQLRRLGDAETDIELLAALRQERLAPQPLEPESQWNVTPTTVRLLRHWRNHEFANQRPFFCQVEAVETVIWLTEVAPRTSGQGRRFWAHLEAANAASNPELMRLALKLATGAGKTTVMAMLIAWQTVNAVRHPDSKRFTKGFLVVAPGITIKDRLRVLQPNDPESYYRSREIVPEDMVAELGQAKIVITNYHAFKRKDELPLNKVQEAALATKAKPETDGALVRRVAGALMGMKNVVVLNDEAHHCYRERPLSDEERKALKGDDLDEAKSNNEAARLWISGLEAVKRVLGVRQIYDLSATPFFLKGSGYREGSLFGWVMSDFSLMDAIECGIVKLPRVPIIDNVPGGDGPKFRDLWEEIKKGPVQLPKKGRSGSGALNPQMLPPILLSALDALYGHYEETQKLWRENEVGVDPVFIVVCNNTATSKLVHDYIAGYDQPLGDGSTRPVAGKYSLFRNTDPDGMAVPRTRTLLIAATYALMPASAKSAATTAKLTDWFWSGVLGEFYGSATETKIARDVPDLLGWLAGGPSPRTIGDTSFQASRLDTLRSRLSAAYKGFHALLMRSGCKDFITGKGVEVMTVYADAMDIHHIFPRAWCEKNGIGPGTYNSIVNKTALSALSNRAIGGDAPGVYLARIEKRHGLSGEQLEAILRTHLIEPDLLRANDFAGFYEARKARLAELAGAAQGKPVLLDTASPEGVADDDGLTADEEEALEVAA